MTGFSSLQNEFNGFEWNWELRSVNGRSLDLRIKLPSGFESLEADLRASASRYLYRGNVSASLTIRSPNLDPVYSINERALEQLMTQAKALSKKFEIESPRVESFLGFRDFIQVSETRPAEEEYMALRAEITKSFNSVLALLKEARKEEGVRLGAVLVKIIDDIEASVELIKQIAENQSARILAALEKRVKNLVGDLESIPADRMAQEVALIAMKSDIGEELDRLSSHVEASRSCLKTLGPVGKKIDFLCQELNREANTICSKSTSIEITETGLELKLLVDKFREQVQNIE